MDVLIVGGGIGGLTLALTLHRAGIASCVYEAAPQMRAVGVGINILPHAAKELTSLGLDAELSRVAVATREAVFYNRFGQLIFKEPLGRAAGYDWPQYSIHRGDLQSVLLEAVQERLGPHAVRSGWKCVGFEQDGSQAIGRFQDATTGELLEPQHGAVLVGCDGIHSRIRKQLHPGEGEPLYSGINMWRGVTRWPPFLSGASMVRAGWLAKGKMVIYPIRNRIDEQGNQLVNWVAEIETPRHVARDWSRRGELSDFIAAFEDWHFPWLDVPAFLRAADSILEFPMVDQDPLPFWTRGRVTLLGDAAHPMVPRGSNGAGQAILDARVLADELSRQSDPVLALAAYETKRLPATASVVRMNRQNPPDAILREVFLRSGDKPFSSIEDVISEAELQAISDRYKRVAGYDRASLEATASNGERAAPKGGTA
jgi:2-polyprenyl-6-methoxyphenol hydroxylase-like FAD-dependent oxidoreductase